MISLVNSLIKGLFGTNNVENYDDLRMPNGRVASNIPQFVSSYEMNGKSQCKDSEDSKFISDTSGDDDGRCRKFFDYKDGMTLIGKKM